MSPPVWTAEQGALLKDLRQKAGLDTATLARKHILSPAQVVQLENGGDSAFYNPDIKYASGKKLLHALGHDLPKPEPEPEPEPKPSEMVRSIAKPTLHKERKELKERKENKARLPRPSTSLSSQNFFWPLLFLLIGLGVLGIYVEKSSEPATPINTAAQPAQTPSSPSTSPPTSSPSEAIPDTPKVIVPKAESPLPAPVASNLSGSKTICNWQTTALEIQPTSPRKSAEYVHMVAQQNVVVCIKDAEQRVATLELEAGKERSIYGPAPFAVYSTNLAQLNLYFQGQLVKLPDDKTQHLKLTAATR
jgi:transcriptional regulator with XRE-family HTH domain